jgi:hypothetical protein
MPASSRSSTSMAAYRISSMKGLARKAAPSRWAASTAGRPFFRRRIAWYLDAIRPELHSGGRAGRWRTTMDWGPRVMSSPACRSSGLVAWAGP